MPSLDTPMPPWGMYAPEGISKCIRVAVGLGLAHGPVKRMFQWAWSNSTKRQPVDIEYCGVKFRLYPWDNAIEGKMLFGSKMRDKQELYSLRKLADIEGSVFLDIGANIGYYSLIAAAFGIDRILAVEPNPYVYQRLLFNIDANNLQDRVTAIAVALGRSTEDVHLAIAPGDMGGSRIGNARFPGEAVQVPMKPLISLIQEQAVAQIDALKIDVEGMEDEILVPFFESASRSLWPTVVIIEHINQREWTTDILSMMLDNGYMKLGESRSNTILHQLS
jgi:FkbM family methyltransferase